MHDIVHIAAARCTIVIVHVGHVCPTMDRQMDAWTGRPPDRQTDRQADRWMN